MCTPSSKIYFIIWIVFTSSTVLAQASPQFELYILMGQSNMAGRGLLVSDLLNVSNDSVFMFTQDKQWMLARHPLHFDKPSVVGVGPGLAFGIKMAKAHRWSRIGLVPCAVGGTPIESWLPGAYDQATKTHPYDDAVERIKSAMQYGIIKGVIWHQGEANSSPEKVAIYLTQLSEFIERVRKLINEPNLPFVAGQLGSFFKNSEIFNKQLDKLPKTVPFTAVVSSKGLTDKGDQLHFDGLSASKLGERYAKTMLKLQKQMTKSGN